MSGDGVDGGLAEVNGDVVDGGLAAEVSGDVVVDGGLAAESGGDVVAGGLAAESGGDFVDGGLFHDSGSVGEGGPGGGPDGGDLVAAIGDVVDVVVASAIAAEMGLHISPDALEVELANIMEEAAALG